MVDNHLVTNWCKEVVYLSRYAGTGLVNTILGFLVIFSAVALGFSPIVSNVAGYSVGFSLGFVLTKKYVFRSNGHFIKESIRYLVVFFISFLINLLVLQLALDYLNLNVLTSQFLAAISYMIIMYLLTRLFVFNSVPLQKNIAKKINS
jgi:putative flippase GtrA